MKRAIRKRRPRFGRVQKRVEVPLQIPWLKHAGRRQAVHLNTGVLWQQ